MHSKWMGRIGLLALVTGVMGGSSGLVGCAAERDPINRVQLNALPKSFFVGSDYTNPKDDPEFYARTMVVDVPYGESGSDFLMFTNTINSMSRIKWQIQERFLVGRVSFERIDGTDGKGLTPDNTERDFTKTLAQNEGLVVYQFPITSQFDIRKQYNSQTGEEGNVVEENASDRHWTERDYIRVDFSQNLVTAAYDFDTLSLLGVYNGIKWTSAPFEIQNPKDQDAPVVDTENGYFDVTNKAFAQPQMLHLWGMTFPGCLLPNIISGGTQPVGNCNPNEITLRHSFKRVVPTDYEPTDWTGDRFETYGAFFSERLGYARDYGVADKTWRRYINRYNIWERSHAYKDLEKMEGPTECRIDADCAGVGSVEGMSRCDGSVNKCTLPFTERKAKPIVWHYSQGSNPIYFDSTRDATEEWDAAMREAVLTAKYAECKRFGLDDAGKCPVVPVGNFADEQDLLPLVKEMQACRRGEVPGVTGEEPCVAHVMDLAERRSSYITDGNAKNARLDAMREIVAMQPMVILCHSPVAETDPEVCGKAGTVARLGDIRYHLVTSVEKPETNSPWGIMSDSNDPLTGEHVSSSINIWTHVNDLFARGIVDTLRYIGGELKTQDITDGTYVNNWVEAAKTMNGVGAAPVLGGEEADKRIAAVAGVSVEQLRQVKALRKSGARAAQHTAKQAELRKALLNDMKRVQHQFAAADAPSTSAPMAEARRNMAQGTTVEAEAITPAMQQLATAGFGKIALDTTTKVQATSIFQGLNPKIQRDLERRRDMALAARGACVMPFEATAPMAYIGMKDVLEQKFGRINPADPIDVQMARADRMKDYIRRRAQSNVIVHEMGHSFGLRHNFVSSSDGWNFRPQYWQLRTNDKEVSSAFCDEKGTADGKTCVGPRWLDPVTANETKNLITMWTQSTVMDYAGEPAQDMLGLGVYDFAAARMFYGDVATVYADSKWRAGGFTGNTAMQHQNDFGGLLGFRYGDFSNPIHYSHLDGEMNLIEKCGSINVEDFKPSNWNEEKDGVWSPLFDGLIVTNEAGKATKCTMPKVDYVQFTTLKTEAEKIRAVDDQKRVRVPHGFASDEWADLGNVAVFRHDNGADLYETMHFWMAQQEMNHIFTSYRRGRRDFSVWGGFQRTLGRYHEKMRDSAKAIGLYVNLARDTVAVYNDGSTNPDQFVADILEQVAVDNTIASSIAFDHFAHVFARPQPGPHGPIGDEIEVVLRSWDGTGFAGTAGAGRESLNVANGVQGTASGFGTISFGGRPIENKLADNQGRDYDRDYTMNVGSYYEKAFTSYLFTESADNFISSSRDDFVDPRFRSVSLADIFPDGFRRWLGNNLTGDDEIKGVYTVPATAGPGPQPPALDPAKFATLGNTSWWPKDGAEICYPQGEKLYCRNPFEPSALNSSRGTPVDPQVGWEQQKFAILFSLIYLPDNQRTNWLNQIRIWEVGAENNPEFPNRIEFHDPTGRTYVAQTFGTEVLFGKTVQKGVAARVLQYANQLLANAYQGTPVLDAAGNVVRYNVTLDANGNAMLKSGTTCSESRACTKLQSYTAMPKFLREAEGALGWTRVGGLKGVY